MRTSGLYPKYLLCDPHQQYHHRSTTSVIPASTTYKTDFLTSLIEIRLPQPQPQPQPQLQPKPLNESCSGVCSGCNQARRDSTWFTDRVRAHTSVAKNHCQYQVNWQLSIVNTTSIDSCKVPTDTKDFQADAPGLQCWQCDGSVSTFHPFFFPLSSFFFVVCKARAPDLPQNWRAEAKLRRLGSIL